MEGIVINIMSKAKKTESISNFRAHNARIGKATDITPLVSFTER